MLNRHRSTIDRFLSNKSYKLTYIKKGRKPKLSSNDISAVVNASDNQSLSCREIVKELNLNVTPSTISRYLSLNKKTVV